MVLTVRQVTTFFENTTQMAMPHSARIQLQSEGISSPNDLVEFYADSISTISNNLRRPGGIISYPNHNATAGSTISAPPFVFRAKSHMILAATCDLSWHYATVRRKTSIT